MKHTRQRYQQGSVLLSKRSSGKHVWQYRYSEQQPDGTKKRKAIPIGTISKYPTKSAAEKAANYLRIQANEQHAVQVTKRMMSDALARFAAEEVSRRISTRRSVLIWIDRYISPKWGNSAISDVKPMAVREWLTGLGLAPLSKGALLSIMRRVYDCAMLWEWVDCAINPLSLVKIKGITHRQKKPRILSVDEFHAVLARMPEGAYRTMVIVVMCLGIRRSEMIALQWGDFDWEEGTVSILRGIVMGNVDQVKTRTSGDAMPLDPALIEVLKSWRKATEFSADTDWVFASPARAGEKPYVPEGVCTRFLGPIGVELGLGRIGWHTFRHTYRTWLDSVGVPMGVQQKLMRHSDIRTTMNVYGGSLLSSMREANSKVVEMATRPQSRAASG